MNLTNEEPRPRSNRLNEYIKIESRTHAPKSPTFKWLRMYGVSRRLIKKLHDLPSTLKNVFVASFLEKSPRKVTCSVSVVTSFTTAVKGRQVVCYVQAAVRNRADCRYVCDDDIDCNRGKSDSGRTRSNAIPTILKSATMADVPAFAPAVGILNRLSARMPGKGGENVSATSFLCHFRRSVAATPGEVQ